MEQSGAAECASADLLPLLREFVAGFSSGSIAKLSTAVLVKLADAYPKLRESGSAALKELLEGQHRLAQAALVSVVSGSGDAKAAVQHCTKLNQMLSSVRLARVMPPERAGEWAQSTVDQVLRLCAGALGEQSSLQIGAKDLATWLRLPLESLEQLSQEAAAGEEPRLLQAQEQVGTRLITGLLDLYESEGVKQRPEARVEVFKVLLATLGHTCGDQHRYEQLKLEQSARQQPLASLLGGRVERVILEAIRSVSTPLLHSDAVTLGYFSSLLSFVGPTGEAFLGRIGVQFVVDFTLRHHSSSG